MTAVLSDMSIFCVRAGCKMQLASYGSKNALQSLSDKPFVHTDMHNLKTTENKHLSAGQKIDISNSTAVI